MLLEHLPVEAIRARYREAPGRELESGKFDSPESSSALVANTFGWFIGRPTECPPPPGWAEGWEPISLQLEVELRFPWRGGHHPWLDVVVETSDHLVGIESKRYEPYRGHNNVAFSEAYWRAVWGKRMRPYEWLRDGLARNPTLFNRLDAAQLIKHAFGLRTRAHARRKRPVLLYLFAEPRCWPDGTAIDQTTYEEHRNEVDWFARLVSDAEVRFQSTTYRLWLDSMATASVSGISRHVAAINSVFAV